MYKVKTVTFFTNEGNKKTGYQILKNSMPVFRVNCFLEIKGNKSEKTSKQYAYRLCKFLNFLEDKRNKKYKEATKQDIAKFIDSIIFETNGLVYIEKGRVSYNTISHYITVIKEFYRYLEDILNHDTVLVSEGGRRSNKHSYLYGQIWDIEVGRFLNSKIERVKGTKGYVKWYSNDEIEAIKSNFRTLRDKAIFLLSLEGLRIDEILSLRESDFDPNEYCVYPYRSKGRETGNVGSTVAISMETSQAIIDYIFTERDEVLIKLQEKNIFDFTTELFVNLRNGNNLGQPLKYRNWISILKRVAEISGLNPDMIRTHSGRSTKTMELLHYQVEHPEDNLTDEHIRQIMRWKSPSSITPYINTKDNKISVETAKKIHNVKEKQKNGNNDNSRK